MCLPNFGRFLNNKMNSCKQKISLLVIEKLFEQDLFVHFFQETINVQVFSELPHLKAKGSILDELKFALIKNTAT